MLDLQIAIAREACDSLVEVVTDPTEELPRQVAVRAAADVTINAGKPGALPSSNGRMTRPARMRELKYGENGVTVGTPGEWQPLYQNIEGYTHEAGIRNVLRVKRFNLKNPPAGAPSTRTSWTWWWNRKW